MAKVVTIEVEERGLFYTVAVIDVTTHETIDEHFSDNIVSGAWSADGEPPVRSLEEMKRLALATAWIMSDEHNAPVDENIQIVEVM